MQLPESREGFVEALENLNRDLELPSLRECCGGRELEFRQALPKMAADALASGSPANNPVVPTEEEIVALYLDAWGLSS
jgi:alcohol dehydrogenase class IV